MLAGISGNGEREWFLPFDAIRMILMGPRVFVRVCVHVSMCAHVYCSRLLVRIISMIFLLFSTGIERSSRFTSFYIVQGGVRWMGRLCLYWGKFSVMLIGRKWGCSFRDVLLGKERRGGGGSLAACPSLLFFSSSYLPFPISLLFL